MHKMLSSHSIRIRKGDMAGSNFFSHGWCEVYLFTFSSVSLTLLILL